MDFEIYTDGACSGNPGPGGYAFIIKSKGTDLKVAGFKRETTNNQMELTAIVRALEHMQTFPRQKDNTVTLYSDSAYCINSINGMWLKAWKDNGWKTRQDKEVANRELWERLYEVLSTFKAKLKFVKIKGHSGNKYNELVDKAAKEIIKKNLNANCTK